MSTLAGWPTMVLSGVFGLALGSFANVAIHRWPRKQSVVHPPSACPSCGTPIVPRDNVPVVSWLLLRGRCRHCGEPISPRYPAVELLVAGLWAATAAVNGATWWLPALLVLVWALVVATFIDLEHRIIPNRLTYPLAPALALLLLAASAITGEWAALLRGVLTGLGLASGMFLLSELFRVVRGKAGMGMGDVKLAVSIGLVLGYLGGWFVVIGLYATIISAAVIAFTLIALGRAKLASRIPFGPYLAVGSLVAVLGGDPIADAVRGWLGLT